MYLRYRLDEQGKRVYTFKVSLFERIGFANNDDINRLQML